MQGAPREILRLPLSAAVANGGRRRVEAATGSLADGASTRPWLDW